MVRRNKSICYLSLQLITMVMETHGKIAGKGTHSLVSKLLKMQTGSTRQGL